MHLIKNHPDDANRNFDGQLPAVSAAIVQVAIQQLFYLLFAVPAPLCCLPAAGWYGPGVCPVQSFFVTLAQAPAQHSSISSAETDSAT